MLEVIEKLAPGHQATIANVPGPAPAIGEAMRLGPNSYRVFDVVHLYRRLGPEDAPAFEPSGSLVFVRRLAM